MLSDFELVFFTIETLRLIRAKKARVVCIKRPTLNFSSSEPFDKDMFNAKLNQILYGQTKYLVIFLNKFKEILNEYDSVFLTKKELNALALTSLYFVKEYLLKEERLIINRVNNTNTKSNTIFGEESLQMVYFL
jgi:hypothetical protein